MNRTMIFLAAGILAFSVCSAPAWSASTNLLANGDFESGRTGWMEYSSGGFPIITPEASPAHSGSWHTWFGGYEDSDERLFQNITVPADATSVYARFWYRIGTKELLGANPNDTLRLVVASPVANASTYNELQTLATLSNLDATAGVWVQSVTCDLTAFKGQSVAIGFVAVNDSANVTNFWVDDAAVVARYSLTTNITGGGTVNNFNPDSPPFSPCSAATCTASFDAGSVFTLRGAPAVSFAGWSGGGCSGSGDCSITLNGDTTVTATFDPLVQIFGHTTPFQSLQSAYDAAVAQALASPVLMARNLPIDGSFTMNSPVAVTLEGGYSASSFSTVTGYTTLQGVLTLMYGSLVAENLIIE